MSGEHACWECGQLAPSGVCLGPHPGYSPERAAARGWVAARDGLLPRVRLRSALQSPVPRGRDLSWHAGDWQPEAWDGTEVRAVTTASEAGETCGCCGLVFAATWRDARQRVWRCPACRAHCHGLAANTRAHHLRADGTWVRAACFLPGWQAQPKPMPVARPTECPGGHRLVRDDDGDWCMVCDWVVGEPWEEPVALSQRDARRRA